MSHWGAFTPTVDATGEVVAVRPTELDPDPSPLLGNLVGSVRHPLRVAQPMVRQGWLQDGPGANQHRGRQPFVPVSWDVALQLLSDELRRVYDGPGPGAVFGGSYGWSSAGRFHHAQSQVHRFLNTLGGFVRSVNTYSAGTSEVLLPHVFGADADVVRSLTSWPVVAAHTELLVCFGGVPGKNDAVAPGGVTRHRTAEHLRTMLDRGAAFVLVGSDRRDLPPWLPADWLAARPGTDTALILALCQVLVRDGLADLDFVASHCSGFEQVLPYLTGESDGVPKTPQWAAAITGITAGTITALATRMAQSRTMVSVTFSLQRAEFGEQPVWAAVLLAALLGQIGLPGGGFGHGYGSLGDNGYPDHGVPLSLPQLANPVSDSIPVARIADLLLDPGGGYEYNGSRRRYPRIELLYWCGGNPFHHHQHLSRLREAWGRPATVVVHEPYWTATARHADIVLPSTVSLERDDIGASRTDPFLTAMHARSDRYEQSRDDFATFSALADLLGTGKEFTEGRDAGQWLRHLYDEWRSGVQPGLEPGVQPDPDLRIPDFDTFWRLGRAPVPTRPATVLLHRFRTDPSAHPLTTPTGRIQLSSDVVAGFGYPDCPGHPAWLEPTQWHGSAQASTYPLVLLANNPAARLHSQLDFGSHSRASKIDGREPVRVNPADAQARGLHTGDLVRVFNDLGACLGGAVLDPEIAAGVVQMSTGAWFSPVAQVEPVLCAAGNVNVLTPDVGSSRLSQGCSGARALVQIQRWRGPVPPIDAARPPPTTESQQPPAPQR